MLSSPRSRSDVQVPALTAAAAGGAIYYGRQLGNAIANYINENRAEEATANAPAQARGLQPYDVGSYNDLKGQSVPGDNLDIHHVPQQQPAGQIIEGYDPKTAPAIAIPSDEHRQIPTDKGPAMRPPRDQLAKDAKDLRKTKAPKKQIQKVVDRAKKQYPELQKKPETK